MSSIIAAPTQLSSDIPQQEQNIVRAFDELQRKASGYFAALRELPFQSWGASKPYFQKTFEIFTLLWKFQQDHRRILERRAGLKRHEIGDIAAKISQLYYHYYLRTSSARYLFEALTFFEAIASRNYFVASTPQEQQFVIQKKLRCFARFVVVALLLNRRSLARELLSILRNDVAILVQRGSTENSPLEWMGVIEELNRFLHADEIVSIGDNNDRISYRTCADVATVLQQGVALPSPRSRSAQPRSPLATAIASQPSTIQLQQALLISNRRKTVKFSELTIDLFRIMQSLESPAEHLAQPGNAPLPALRNPQKHILYRSSASEILMALANSISQIEDSSGAIFLYANADSSPEGNGLATSSKLEETDSITLSDVLPFTRRPMFMVIDSESGDSFFPREEQRRFGAMPLVILAAPRQLPSDLADHQSVNGGILTHFLTNPVLALCSLFKVSKISDDEYSQLWLSIDGVFEQIKHLLRSYGENLDHSYSVFLDNSFTEAFILRFLFCSALLDHLSGGSGCAPKCFPAFPDSLMPQVGRFVLDFCHNSPLDLSAFMISSGIKGLELK